MTPKDPTVAVTLERGMIETIKIARMKNGTKSHAQDQDRIASMRTNTKNLSTITVETRGATRADRTSQGGTIF